MTADPTSTTTIGIEQPGPEGRPTGAPLGRTTAPPLRRVALVTYGFEYGGGVRTVAQWLWDGLLATGRYSVAMHDLATFSRDTSSRRLMVPTSWLRRDLRTVGPGGWYTHWGANAVELEIMRYRPRRQLTAALRDADIVQVVSGAPACAAPVVRAGVPVVLQVASLVGWERPALLASSHRPDGPGAGG
ncbi:hypothetical protein GCM10027605_25070 [Micromonospora zhanjiangensis]